MKNFLPIMLMIAGAGFTQASIIETISINLSNLHAGSTLSGSFILPDAPAPGDSAPVLLSFSDPSDYSVASLSATITIGSPTPDDTVRFSDLTFTNPTGNSFTRNIDLIVVGAAQCASFPCTATGGFEDGNPASFRGSYTITPAAVPEPGYGAPVLVLLARFALRRRVTI